MTDIFISYKRENLAAAQRLVQGLRGANQVVWWDQDIAPDDSWEAKIERQLESAKAVIVVWSTAAVASENVKAEARRARNKGKLIQVFAEPCEPPLFFGERQGVDLSGWSGEARDHRFQTVLAAVRAIQAGKNPPLGVGYKPKRSNLLAWIVPVGGMVSGALALAANLGGTRDTLCSIGPLAEPCARYGLVAAEHEPPPLIDLAAILAAERTRLLSGLNGSWARGDEDPVTGKPRDCSQAVSIEAVTDAAGVARIHVTAEGFESLDQVDGAADGVVRVIGRDTNGVVIEGKYEPNGDQLTYTTGERTTKMRRCPAQIR